MIITKSIDSLSEIDLASVSINDLCFRYGTHRSLGKTVPSRTGVQTAIGDVLASVWYDAVERIALRDYESWIVDSLEEWVKNSPSVSNRREGREYALQLYSMRIYEDRGWVSYIPFNRKHRPSAIAGEQFLMVVSECCKQPGEMTREAFNTYHTFCPICGRASKVTKYVEGAI